MNKPFNLGRCRAHRDELRYFKGHRDYPALLVELDSERPEKRWVPLHCLHKDSPVREGGVVGDLWIVDGCWWAREEGF